MICRRNQFTLVGRKTAISMTYFLVLVGCSETSREDRSQPEDASTQTVLLLTAASTTDAITEVAARFEKQTGTRIRVTTGGSNALASQILAGVPGEVFLSANPTWADAVVDAGLASAHAQLLANRLVIIAPRGNRASVRDPRDLLRSDVERIALAGEYVPAGMYAAQALRHAGVYDALVEQNRIARGQNVRLTLSYVETGEAAAGVVYATDARASERVEVVYTFPVDSHDPIVYPLVLLKSPSHADAGRRFYSFLFSKDAMRVFARHGFTTANPQEGDAP